MQARIRREVGIRAARDKSSSHRRALTGKEVKNMLGIIAAVLMVLCLLGFLAFHVSTGVIHVLLVIGIVMLLAHFFRGGQATS
jgi:1,4-dihydroxy-2-naphthoate octaprenyltransferase